MENYNRIVKNKYRVIYYLNDDLHRLDGPAIECYNGDKEWYQNGLKHRLYGPACERNSGYKEWFQNGKRHRTDGPACEYVNGAKEWWIEGKRIYCNSQEEFERYLKLKLFW
jgi:hypothetical protein